AQPPAPPVVPPAAAEPADAAAGPPPGFVRLTFPGEVELPVLVDYVSERLGIKILHDQTLAGQSITLRAPGDVPVASLEDLLRGALRIKGFVLADSPVEGWKTIRPAADLPRAAGAGSDAVTRVFTLEHADPSGLTTLLQPFLSTAGASAAAVEGTRLLIVTDFAGNLARVEGLIEAVDRPRTRAETRFVDVTNTAAEDLAARLTELLAAAAPPGAGGEEGPGAAVSAAADARTNRLILVGPPEALDRAEALAEALDVPLGLSTRVFDLTTVPAERLDRLAKGVIGERDAARLYRGVIDEEANVLIVTAPEAVLERVAELAERLDAPGAAAAGGRVRFYKLKYATAEEILETLLAVGGAGGLPAVPPGGLPRTDGRYRLLGDRLLPGANRATLLPQQNLGVLPVPPAFTDVDVADGLVPNAGGVPGAVPGLGAPPAVDGLPAGADPPALPPAAGFGGAGLAGAGAGLPGAGGLTPVGGVTGGGFGAAPAQVTADPRTNTVIVVADPVTQGVYAELIEELDRPRPQVLIEAKIVVLDVSDEFSLGVEIGGGDAEGPGRLFAFSSFGLSEVDPLTGALQLIPGLGFNGTLVDPAVADVVLRAFTTHRRSRVVSSPRVLVDDNATGLLTSVTEVPFTSVNASQVVATTSFAGFADAGTTITVTPRITDDDRLRLEYRITLNEFQGTGSDGTPPPRITNEIESEVTVPDGHTLIVGGLNRSGYSHTTDSIPYLEAIPILRHLVSAYGENVNETALFIFLKPVILRDDKFKDLKYLSRRDVAAATLAPDAPASLPVLLPCTPPPKVRPSVTIPHPIKPITVLAPPP
ncbi:secretin N-terminal domain-containing protein, partial [Alienimonas sp. DA493]|uniref:secretin N-terminal domain-containing protein n=1 Tax=Alienimonas sp. DA493 TaxID=3373605 RepID=UPI003755005D